MSKALVYCPNTRNYLKACGRLGVNSRLLQRVAHTDQLQGRLSASTASLTVVFYVRNTAIPESLVAACNMRNGVLIELTSESYNKLAAVNFKISKEDDVMRYGKVHESKDDDLADRLAMTANKYQLAAKAYSEHLDSREKGDFLQLSQETLALLSVNQHLDYEQANSKHLSAQIDLVANVIMSDFSDKIGAQLNGKLIGADGACQLAVDLLLNLKKASSQLSPAEAVFGMIGWLTSRDAEITMSGHHNATVAAQLSERFLRANNLISDGLENNVSPDFPDRLIMPDDPELPG